MAIKNNKKAKNVAIALGMCTCLLIGGISAYFTSTDTADNEFKIGEIDINLVEPNWDPGDARDVTPNETLQKDPQIYNNGESPAYMFMKVQVPTVVAPQDGLKVAAANGTVSTRTGNVELFTLDGLAASDWIEVGTASFDSTTGMTTHVLAYSNGNGALQSVDAGDVTDAAFQSVTFINAVEGQGLEKMQNQIGIAAYAIQDDNLGSATTPAAVWAILQNQTPSAANGAYNHNAGPENISGQSGEAGELRR